MTEQVDDREAAGEASPLEALRALDPEPEVRGSARRQAICTVAASDLHLGQPHLVPAAPVLALAEIDGSIRLHGPQVGGNGLLNRRVDGHRSVLEQYPALAERLNHRHVVADEDDSSSLFATALILPMHLRWESDVADCENLVDEQDLGLEVRRHPRTRAARSSRSSSA